MIELCCDSCQTKYKVKEELAGRKAKCRKCSAVMVIPAPVAELPDLDSEFPLEVTEGGSTVHRHEARMRDFEFAVGDSENIELISQHITKHIGPVENVFHEIVSDLVHIDIHIVDPTEERPFYTLVTSGMSDRPMAAPEDTMELKYLELFLCLPPDWSFDFEGPDGDKNYWPIGWLKHLARMPHEFETWLFACHTIPNGDPAEPVGEGVPFTGWMVFPGLTVPDEFSELHVGPDKMINFMAIYPLYETEMNLKLNKGVEALIKGMEKHQVTEIIDVDRSDTCKRKGWFR